MKNDSKVRTILYITDNDIRTGKKGVPEACPIAHALNRSLKFGYTARVLISTTKIMNGNEIVHRIRNSRPMQRFIKVFDQGWYPGLGTFSIKDIPSDLLSAGALRL